MFLFQNVINIFLTFAQEEAASPDVFISYQWGKQPEVKALYARLSEAGFSCWMDIAQMGGGDSLYEKIDRGVRGCQVVLSCVTRKYALSANCRREVSLADALKKPIVPLLLETSAWPPEGPMSMVFTQLLYINFCSPDESVQRHWKGAQFEELLSKITAHVKPITDVTAPNETSIQSSAKPKSPKKESNEPETKTKPESKAVEKTKTPEPKKSGACMIL